MATFKIQILYLRKKADYLIVVDLSEEAGNYCVI